MERRGLDELINRDDPGWPIVLDWLRSGENHYEILPTERSRGEQTLLEIQVTSRSILGAIALETGGILIDHGWLRLLGAGSDRMRGNLANWNGLGGEPLNITLLQGAFVVAHDAAGGFFAMNGGALPGPQFNVFYCAPDTLKWEDLRLTYQYFVNWATTSRLSQFYESLRWPGWKEEVAGVPPDRGTAFYPFLCTKEGSPAGSMRSPVPMTELWGLHVNG